MPATIATDITGQTFGKLTALRRGVGADRKRAYWVCRCECGAEVTKKAKYLLNGDTRSCGCAQKAMRARGNVRHGGFLLGVRLREYTIWRSMKSRCYTKSSSNFRFYGARGVTVCDRWRDDFATFCADMGDCPPDYTLDRINPHGNYAPDNCRWASWETQHANIRKRHAASLSVSRSS